MIVSTEHKYIFVQLPHTGCTAVARELVTRHGGEPLLGKHSTLDEFLSLRRGSIEEWYVFSAVRHPLDELVSIYEKLRSDHEGYANPANHVSEPGGFVDDKAVRRFQFVQDGASFDEFLRRYFRMPFDTWASLDHRSFDSVMRFERLNEDFKLVLMQLGLDATHDLPPSNRTKRDRESWESYYDDLELRRFIGPRVYPYMRRWGYDFPAGWEGPGAFASGLAELAYLSLRPRRKRIWRQPAPVFAGDLY